MVIAFFLDSMDSNHMQGDQESQKFELLALAENSGHNILGISLNKKSKPKSKEV